MSLFCVVVLKFPAFDNTQNVCGNPFWTGPDSIGNYTLYDIAFANDSIGYIVGGFTQYDISIVRKGVIFKTIDGGINWSLIDSSYFDGLTKLQFPSEFSKYKLFSSTS